MIRIKPKFDVVGMVRASSMAKYWVDDALKKAEDLRLDPSKIERLEKAQCKACFYLFGRIGGASITNQPCACCGDDQVYGSTCTDILCLRCAKTNNLCKHCGGDIDMRERRRKWPKVVQSSEIEGE